LPQYVALSRADGTVAIMLHPGSPTPQDIAKELAKMPAQFISQRLINANQIPNTRDYRAAWIDDGNGPIKHDMPRAREVHRERLREQRGPLLAALDTGAIRAIEDDDAPKKAQVKAAKQKLRDAPADPRIEAAQNVAALAALTLDVLVQ
jgi:hypothetical protein